MAGRDEGIRLGREDCGVQSVRCWKDVVVQPRPLSALFSPVPGQPSPSSVLLSLAPSPSGLRWGLYSRYLRRDGESVPAASTGTKVHSTNAHRGH